MNANPAVHTAQFPVWSKKADEFARRLALTDGTVIPMEDVLMLDGAIFGQNE